MKIILILLRINCGFHKITFAHKVTMFSVHFVLIWKVWTNPFFVFHNPSMCPYNQVCWQLCAGLLLWKNYSLTNSNWQLSIYRTHKCLEDTWYQKIKYLFRSEFDGSSEWTNFIFGWTIYQQNLIDSFIQNIIYEMSSKMTFL